MAFDLLALVKDAKTIGITGHLNPDGDCIASNLALAMCRGTVLKYFWRSRKRHLIISPGGIC